MTKIHFYKMSGGGNDFIIINTFNTHLETIDKDKLAILLCNRYFSIGADGLIFIEPSYKADFFYRHYNPDGSLANICGNGSRCISLFAYTKNYAGQKMKFESPAGIFSSEIFPDNQTVKVSFVPAINLRLNIPINTNDFAGNVHYIEPGVPHAILFFDNIEELDVAKIGKQILYHPQFQPAGTNVNFVSISDDKNIKLRTFERGLEYETMACGTGAISSSILTNIIKNLQPPIYVHTKGGMILEIDFTIKHDSNSNPIGAENITMTGEAKFVFEGSIEI